MCPGLRGHLQAVTTELGSTALKAEEGTFCWGLKVEEVKKREGNACFWQSTEWAKSPKQLRFQHIWVGEPYSERLEPGKQWWQTSQRGRQGLQLGRAFGTVLWVWICSEKNEQPLKDLSRKLTRAVWFFLKITLDMGIFLRDVAQVGQWLTKESMSQSCHPSPCDSTQGM